jgi:hypothetical protein
MRERLAAVCMKSGWGSGRTSDSRTFGIVQSQHQRQVHIETIFKKQKEVFIVLLAAVFLFSIVRSDGGGSESKNLDSDDD